MCFTFYINYKFVKSPNDNELILNKGGKQNEYKHFYETNIKTFISAWLCHSWLYFVIPLYHTTNYLIIILF